MRGFCPVEEYEDVLEKLVRGKCLQANNQFSEIFKETYKKKMAEAGCLGAEEEIIISKLAEALESGTLEIKSLSESLGREKDQSQ